MCTTVLRTDILQIQITENRASLDEIMANLVEKTGMDKVAIEALLKVIISQIHLAFNILCFSLTV